MRFKLKPHLIFYIKTCCYRKVHHPVCLVEIPGRWSINWTLYFSLQSHCSIGKFYAKIKLEIGCDVIYHDCTAMRFSWKLLVPEMRINSSSPETRQFTENMSSLIAFWDNSYIWVVWRTSKCLYSTYKKKYIFFSIWVFFHDYSRITGLQGKGQDISLTPHYHFHLLHRHLDISQAITAESSLLHIANLNSTCKEAISQWLPRKISQYIDIPSFQKLDFQFIDCFSYLTDVIGSNLV